LSPGWNGKNKKICEGEMSAGGSRKECKTQQSKREIRPGWFRGRWGGESHVRHEPSLKKRKENAPQKIRKETSVVGRDAAKSSGCREEEGHLRTPKKSWPGKFSQRPKKRGRGIFQLWTMSWEQKIKQPGKERRSTIEDPMEREKKKKGEISRGSRRKVTERNFGRTENPAGFQDSLHGPKITELTE